MHPNPAFRGADDAKNLDYARSRGFGVLVVADASSLHASHIPFRLNESGEEADIHLVRSNPIARMERADALLIVNGPDGYVSPDWYHSVDQVPTWNYVAIHLRGALERLPQDEMRPMLDRQSAAFEARLLPKPPWSVDKMSSEAIERNLRQIVPFRFVVSGVQGTWKLNQNKTADARMGAAQAISGGFGQELGRLSDLMRNEE